jgi:ADP-ribosylglycohydrolase
MNKNNVDGLILGSLVGDALGVPVEFQPREIRRRDPVKNMREFGTHNQPKGTWSDDGSLMLISLETLINKEPPVEALKKFVRWINEGYWTAHGDAFDVGNTTGDAIAGFMQHGKPSAQNTPESNGNGALMRIAPLALFPKDKSNINIEDWYETCREWSCLTHGHEISVFCCFFYTILIHGILEGKTLGIAYEEACRKTKSFAPKGFERLLGDKRHISDYDMEDFKSDGYCLNTLESAIWCAMSSPTYKDSVLMAVNMGDDTDTTASVCGGICGAYYGRAGIPTEWINSLARLPDIENLLAKI